MTQFASTAQFLYDRSIRQVTVKVSKNLEHALTLVGKCKHQSVLRRVLTIVNALPLPTTVSCTYIAEPWRLLSVTDSAIVERVKQKFGVFELVCLGRFRNLNTWLEAEKMKENFKIWKPSK